MKNILLQHYTGTLGELEKLSQANMIKYAEFCGAEYRLLSGDLFNDEYPFSHTLYAPNQKMHMLSEEFDDYDIVVMVDIDMFTRKGMTENIFTDVEGIGMCTDFQLHLHKGLKSHFPTLVDLNYPYWGGAIYRLTKEQRKIFREPIRNNLNDLAKFDRGFNDEGMMHRLAVLTDFKTRAILPGGFKWCHCSYREGIEKSAMIHIRPKVTPTGPKRPKIENYREMVRRELIEE
jgi:hypothetical protein